MTRRSQHTEKNRLTRRFSRILASLDDTRAQWTTPELNWHATELVVLLTVVNEEAAELCIPPFLPSAVGRVQQSATGPEALATALARMVVAAGVITGTIGETS